MQQGHKGALVGEGRTADVFTWTPRSVVKLYHSWWPLVNIEYEARIARMVHTIVAVSPWVGEIIEVEGKHGLIYERIDGPSMESLLGAEPQRQGELARSFAKLQVSLHKRVSRDDSVPTGLPLQRRALRQQITVVAPAMLSDGAKERLLEMLDALPDDTVLCHGDYHPGNVLVSADRHVALDWENARLGNPLADVARTVLLLQAAPLYFPAGSRKKYFLKRSAAFLQTYLQEYVSLTGADLSEIEAWYTPIAAARLSEGVEIEEKYLLQLCSGIEQQQVEPE